MSIITKVCKKYLDKIFIGDIITNHFNTLINDNTEKPDVDDWITFVILPTAFACLMMYLEIPLGNNAISIIITALSIFVGLLFNIIVLLFDILKRDTTQKAKNKLLKQILANIAFTIFLSILIIGMSLLHLVKYEPMKAASAFIIYFSLSFFFITLIMILKRMYSLFDNEMKELQSKE